jgi:hypothetical protein
VAPSSELTDLELLHGIDEAIAIPRQLDAGSLVAEVEGVTVRKVRHHGYEVLRGVYAAVRDPGWGTLPIRFASIKECLRPDGLHLVADGDADDGTIGLDLQLAVEVAPLWLSVTFAAQARRAFAYARIGLNVLLPPGAAGCRYATGDGNAGTFPTLVAPQRYDHDLAVYEAMFPSFQRLAIDMPSLRATLEFEGDDFEVEDQRNWTDASFKVYSTPLRLGYPHHAEAGQRFEQRVSLEVSEER